MAWTVVLFCHINLIVGQQFVSLGWGPPEADPATRVWVQVVYLGGDSWEWRSETEKAWKSIRC